MNRPLNYADHEFVNAKFTVTDADDPGDREFVEFQVEDDVLGLDNDELGMLAYMTASLRSFSTFDSAFSEEAGSVSAEAVIGSNLAGSEYLNESGDFTGTQIVAETDGVAAVGKANDEPGMWAALQTAHSPAFVDAPNQAGGGGGSGRDRLTRHFYDETMEGPYLDSTDDITVGISISRNRSEDNATAICFIEMAFVIFEYDQRRAEFGPVPGGT